MSGGAVTTRWWWVRHAPVRAPPGTIAGRGEFPADLSDAASLAGLAARLPRGAVWLTTPLARSAQTARALQAALGDTAPLRTEPDLLEQDFGVWTGHTHDGLWGGGDPAVATFWQDPAANAPPGGESFAALCWRVMQAIDRLTQAHAGRDIISVGHAGPIRAAVAHALALAPDRALALAVDCLHLTRLDHGGPGLWRVGGLNIPPR